MSVTEGERLLRGRPVEAAEVHDQEAADVSHSSSYPACASSHVLGPSVRLPRSNLNLKPRLAQGLHGTSVNRVDATQTVLPCIQEA